MKHCVSFHYIFRKFFTPNMFQVVSLFQESIWNYSIFYWSKFCGILRQMIESELNSGIIWRFTDFIAASSLVS